jgi:hypothetical protein
MTPFRRQKGVVVGGLIAVAVGLGGVGAYAATGHNGDAQSVSPGEQIAGVPTGPWRMVRANGLNAQDATHVFSLRNGESVGIVGDATAKCLVRTLGSRQAGEGCSLVSGLAQGNGITVSDECGSGEKGFMEILGLAPTSAASVRLLSSDGTSQLTSVVNGAFRFEGMNPPKGAPYPTGVEWVSGAGTGAGTAPLPVGGDGFCP